MQESYKVADATQETKFRVGQTVWCLLYGKGEVIATTQECDSVYPVEVCFESTGESVFYTRDGKYYAVANRTLFFSEPRVIADTEPVFEPKLVGKVVALWSKGSESFRKCGKVIEEKPDSVVFEDEYSVYMKNNYVFHEISASPITFD